jgi:hypothetical protein
MFLAFLSAAVCQLAYTVLNLLNFLVGGFDYIDRVFLKG